MAGYLTRRLLWSLAVLAGIALITFYLGYVLPGDAARSIAGPNASAEDVARIRHSLGLDQPFAVQLAAYVGRLMHGDFGFSTSKNADVLPLLIQRFPATAELAVAGICVEVAIGLPLGIAAATRRGTWFDRLATMLTIALIAAPTFWVGYLLLEAVFQLHKAGISTVPVGGGYAFMDPQYLILPALTIGFAGAAYYNRLARTQMLEVLNSDFVRTARAKGLNNRRVVWRHALRPVIGPVLTQLGLDFGFYLGGLVITEQVFSWPGIGQLAVDSIENHDVPLIMGTVVFGTLCIVMANLAVDVVRAVLDPRIRLARPGDSAR